ncbi:MAG: type IV secretion system DotC family protein [Gammaproteobacteria bacterium]|nr:type IV secretion system DotC family protein [Gammaproteobacteria bacterium]
MTCGILSCLSLLNGCSFTHNNVPNTETLAGLESMANTTNHSFGTPQSMGKIREMALRETALGLSAQSGLADEAKVINNALTRQARALDVIYNFNALLIEPNILPPVLLEGRQTLNLADTQTIRLSDRTYKVSKQARFVTTAPTWRQYLWMDYQKPEVPSMTLLPKTKEERELWRVYAEKGWNKGHEQARIILQESIARIKEDFAGMVLYRKLLAMNMVSAPYVSHTDLGVTGDASEIHIDDRVLRITALPALNTNSDDWHAAVETDNHTIKKLLELEKEVQANQIILGKQEWRPMISPVNLSPK